MQEFKLYNNSITLKFDGRHHLYTVNDLAVDSVTGIIGVVAKPTLIPWAAKEVVKHLGWYEKETWTPNGYVDAPIENRQTGMIRLEAMFNLLKTMSTEEYWEVLKTAKGAHARKKKEAADIGTMTHDWIERFIKGENPDVPDIEKVKNGIEAFMIWVNSNDVKFVLSEQKVYSKKHNYCGTLDFTAVVRGDPFMGDIKTSNFFDPLYFWQISGYQGARQEEHPEEAYKGQVVVRCGKDGALEINYSMDYNKDLVAFLACKAVYDRQRELKMSQLKSDEY